MTQDEEALWLNGALQMSDTLSNTEKVIETLTTLNFVESKESIVFYSNVFQ